MIPFLNRPSRFTGFLLLMVVFTGFAFYSNAQTISGTINTYTKVTGITANNVTVASSTGFSVGSTILIIQMKGATLDQTNTSSFGNVINYNGAGNYEFGVIASINGNTVALKDPLCKTYIASASVQMVLVPVYDNVTVSGKLTCTPWGGVTGGILALKVTGTLTLNADIDVSGNGFRGGIVANGGFNCGVTNWYSAAGTAGGGKGESIAASITGLDGGRGKWAGGGGGGQPGNSGGGGGGNANAGGLGAYEYSGCNTTIQGIGGIALTYSNGIAFMGSGGGGGFADNGSLVTPGTNGGGIMIIDANTVDGNNFTLRSDGLDQTNLAQDESAGGGGAGGCIILNTQTFASNLKIELNGGNGGSTLNVIFSTACHGPGGGGGTGMLFISQPSIPSNVTLTANGGKAGIVKNPASSCYNSSFGGTAGAGTPVTSSTFNSSLPAPITGINLGNDTSICPNGSFLLNAHSGFASYVWQDGSDDSTFSVKDPGIYYVTVSNSIGCKAADTVKVSALTLKQVHAGNDTDICAGQSVLLNAGSGYTNYLWQDGSSGPTFLATSGGTYSVSVTNSLGCSGSDAVTITQHALPVVNLGNDTSICPGASIILDAGPGYKNYLWQDNSNGQTFMASQPGDYKVNVKNTFNCPGADSLTILSFLPVPPANLVSNTVVCPGNSITLTAPSGYKFYLWDTADFTPELSIDEPGTYVLRVINNDGCAGTDSVRVTELCEPIITFPKAFSPNNDGKNDKFRAIAINISTYNLKVFNRWGQLVFETSDIEAGWDGTYKLKSCPVDVYDYVATYYGEINGISKSGTIKGNVTLLR